MKTELEIQKDFIENPEPKSIRISKIWKNVELKWSSVCRRFSVRHERYQI